MYAAALYELNEQDFSRPKLDRSTHLAAAKTAFEVLKKKLTEAPTLYHFDNEKEAVIIVYANDCEISGALMQEHDGILLPVRYAGQLLKDPETRYATVEKEILALLRVLHSCYSTLVGHRIRVITRHSTLAWLFKSSGLHGRPQQWVTILSP